MKKTAALLVWMILCMLVLPALADQMHLADRARVDPGLPEGMAYHSLTWSGDVLNIVIDTDETDWDLVATAARKSGSLVINPGIYHPEINAPDFEDVRNQIGDAMSTDYYRQEKETSWAQSEERTLNYFKGNLRPGSGQNGNTYSCSYQGWAIGNYDESTGLFLPRSIPLSQGAGFAAYWRKSDGTYDAECVRFTVSYTKMPPIYVRRQGVAEGDIRENVKNFEHGPLDSALIKDAKTHEGRIVYTLENGAAGRELFTAVAMPGWVNGSGIQAHLLSNGKEELLTIHAAGTHFAGRESVVLHYKPSAENCLYKKDWAIRWTWKDAGGDEKSSVLYLEAEFYVGEPDFTVAYANADGPGAEPLPASRLSWEISNPLEGLKVCVSDGIFHMVIDEDDLPPNRKTDLSQTTVSALVTPPQGARACAVYMHKGDVIYGNNGERAQKLGELMIAPGEPVVVPELTKRPFFDEVSVMLHNGKYMSYYVAPLMVGEHGGETLVFEWLDSEGSRIGNRQYLALTSDAYHLAVRRNPSETMNPKKAEAFPTVLMEREVSVETAELPQKGENVVRYEIALFDENGNQLQMQQGETVFLYLPYPDGKEMAECLGYTFVIYHELADGGYEVYSTQDGSAALTEYGVCMEVSSFSPYFLNWEETPDAAQLPETGDRSNLTLYVLALCAVCACALAGMRRRTNH